MSTYYKFYSLADCNHQRYCREAITMQKIFMNSYVRLGGKNDDCEGCYLHDRNIEEIFLNRLMREKQDYLIGCASYKLRNPYMWHKFADEGKGICIAFEKNAPSTTSHKIKYVDELPEMTQEKFSRYSLHKQVCYVLLRKRRRNNEEEYEQEKEVRFLAKHNTNNEERMLIKIKAIYIGWNMDADDIRMWQNLAKQKGRKVILLKKSID